MSSLKVLQITNMYPTDAVPNYGTFIRSQIESLEPLGVENDVLFVDGREGAFEYIKGISRLRRSLSENSYDLIHAHYGLSGIIARCQLQLPVVLSFCGKDVLGDFDLEGRMSLSSRLFTWVHKPLSHLCDGVIVKSQGMRTVVPAQSTVIANGVDFERFRPLDQAACRSKLNLDPHARYVLFPYAEDKPRKNYPAVRDAIDILNKERPEVVHLPLIVSNVPNKDIPVFMGAADVLALPSFSEGSPNAVKEALACDLPVVASDAGDIEELLEDLPACFVVDRDAKSVADGIAQSLDTPRPLALREKRASLNAQNAAAAVLNVYAHALKGGRQPSEGASKFLERVGH